MYPNVVNSPLVDAHGLGSHGLGSLSIISGGRRSQKWRGEWRTFYASFDWETR